MDKTSPEIKEKKEKKIGIFQWFLFALIPILVIIAATLIISMIAGVNVFDKAKEVGSKIPIVSEMIGDSPEEEMNNFEEKIVVLEGTVRDREAFISQLEAKLEVQEETMQELQVAKEEAERALEEVALLQDENKRAFKDIVRTYETMSAKKAAPILTEMNESDALQILANIKADALAKILETMLPEKAARFTEKLASERANSD